MLAVFVNVIAQGLFYFRSQFWPAEFISSWDVVIQRARLVKQGMKHDPLKIEQTIGKHPNLVHRPERM